MPFVVVASLEDLYTCAVSGHRWVWIKVHYATDRPWVDEVEWECDYCGAVEYTDLP